jgi:putative endonuclease
MAAHNDFGRAAEQRAADLLQGAGWTIVCRNWRFGRREIDVIARRGATVAFVEVRARRSASHGHPLATIGWRKRREIEIAARGWIALHGSAGEEYRFDAVVLLDAAGSGAQAGTPGLRHVQDAWRPDGC